MKRIEELLSEEFKKPIAHVENVVKLIDDGNTIPFIARYRKEMHGSMDDTVLRDMDERLKKLRSLYARREEVRTSIGAQEKLTDEISGALDAALTLSEIEDIYRPFRPKRRTRAMMAREKGLEKLALMLMAQTRDMQSPDILATDFINEKKGVMSITDALSGARDIIAESISDDADIRKRLRALIMNTGSIVSAAAKDEDSVYALYYEYEEKLSRAVSHRILAINRGEREGFLKVSIKADRERAIAVIRDHVIKNDSPASAELEMAMADSYDRLIFPSVEREVRSRLTEIACAQAIRTFALNLAPLLMQPPIKHRTVLGLDPAYRTGCKVAVVDETGKVLDTAVVYPTPPHLRIDEAKMVLNALIKKHGVSVISIGNGTASRETENFVSELIRGTDISYMVVSEAGASVYSASKLAALEFPDYDVSLRSAVSIARRLQDPLSELVKIDPKSIGVGQYQHDMPENDLDSALTGVVEDCVNSVGVDLNTASAPLLAYVSGISAAVAKNIVTYREANGAFTSRRELKKVPKLGERTFLQCAGFLRVSESAEILDNTSVHPESYAAAKGLLEICGYTKSDVKAGKLSTLPLMMKQRGVDKIASELEVGVPTLNDIARELQKPGRDPRDELPPPLLRCDAMELSELKEGMELMGTVRNVVDFGAFVDIGVHQDGLVHISRICDRYITHPSEVLKTGDVVRVRVLSVDPVKKRISLTMKLD